MKRYVLCIGGTGARVAEALLVAASAGVFRAEMIDVLLADTDRHGQRSAELLRAKGIDYDRMHIALRKSEAAESLMPFHTLLNFYAWPEQLPEGGATLADWTSDSETDELLCRALFGEEAAQVDLRSGLSGQRQLGQTVFAGLLHEAEKSPEDPLMSLVDKMNAALENGEEVRVVLTGSVSGGTGAAGLPLLARYIREKTQGRAKIGAVLLAPSSVGEDGAKARESLADFAGETACSAVTVLGLPRSSCTDAPQDYAHLTDWLAVYSLDILLHRPEWPEGLFTVQTELGPLSWNIFGKAAGRYRLAYGRLIKAATLWDGLIGPQVEKRLRHPFFLRDSLFGWYAHFFRKVRSRPECLEDAARLSRLMRVVLLWLGGLMRTLPPEMTHSAQLAAAMEEAGEHYRSLTGLVGQLALLDDDVQRSAEWEEGRVYRGFDEDENESAERLQRIDAVKKEIARLEGEQQRLNRAMGGAATMAIMQAAREKSGAAIEQLHADYAEANRRIDQAESIAAPEDLYRITDARTKLDRMVRHRQMLDAQHSYVEADARKIQTDAGRFAPPEISGGDGESDLFAAALTDQLLRERRLKGRKLENLYPDMVRPADGRALKTTLRNIKKAHAHRETPVMSLLQALIREAMEEV